MGTNRLGDNIKTAIDALSEADKRDRIKTMRAMGNEIEVFFSGKHWVSISDPTAEDGENGDIWLKREA